MENKNVGLLIIGISIVVAFLVLIFNLSLKSIIGETCSHGSSCSMYSTVSVQTGISLVITSIIFLIGIVILFAKPKEKLVIKNINKRGKKIDFSRLDDEESKVMRLIQKESGGMFQADLMEKMNFSKVKTTRILDKLEAKQLIERKRRGMNNIVILKN
jgi:uncharacterized membrane protein